MDCTGPAVFTAVFLKNDHGYAGYLAELPGVTSHGRKGVRSPRCSPAKKSSAKCFTCLRPKEETSNHVWQSKRRTVVFRLRHKNATATIAA